MDALQAAKSYATVHHVIRKGQLYGVVPYTHHLSDVEKVLREFGWTDETILVASWLHDVVEDTDVKLRDVEENFGEAVAFLVGAVTVESGIDRKTKNALTYPKIRDAGLKAITLKLADRIANVRTGGGMLKKYRSEYKQFRHNLWRHEDQEHIKSMWDELDRIMEYHGDDHLP